MRARLGPPSTRRAWQGKRLGLLALVLLACTLPAARLDAQGSAPGGRGPALVKEAEPLIAQQRWTEVIPLLEKARDATLADRGVSYELYDIEFKLAELHQLTGDVEGAIRQSHAALATLHKLPSADAAMVAGHLWRLAQYHHAAGQREERTETMRKAVELMSDPRLAPQLPPFLEELYDALRSQGAYRASKAVAERAVALDTALGDEQHLVRDLNQLAIAYDWLGDLEAASSTYRRSLEVAGRAFGADHPEVGNVLNDLGSVAEEQGDLLRATTMYERALAIFLESFGEEAWATGGALYSLASVWIARGDSPRARIYAERAVAALAQAGGSDDRDYLQAVGVLAFIHEREGRLDEAEMLYQQVATGYERTFGPDNPKTALALAAVGSLAFVRGDYASARRLEERVRTILEAHLDPDHHFIADSFERSARILQRSGGSLVEAQRLHQRALTLREKTYTRAHPLTLDSMSWLAQIAAARGDARRALRLQGEANLLQDEVTAGLLGAGTAEQKRLLATRLSETSNITTNLHLHLFPEVEAAAELALTTIVRRKGWVLELVAAQLAEPASATQPTAELHGRRRRLAQLLLADDGDPDAIEVARGDIQALETTLGSSARRQPITLERLRATLGEQEALVELTIYQPTSPRDRPDGPPRYAAYVLRRKGPVRAVELGPVARIDGEAEALRTAMADPGSAAEGPARSFYDRVIAPLEPLLDGVTALRVSPEGQLHLVPFAAARAADGKTLLERFRISYLSSGRDLLRERPARAGAGAAVLLGAPDYGTPANEASVAGESTADQGRGARSAQLRILFPPLPGTAREVEALAGELVGARVLTGSEASEEALEGLHGPAILHLATHGFFLSPGSAPRSADGRGAHYVTTEAPTSPASAPLRSAIALAGANHPTEAMVATRHDGLLSASEAAALDLQGTDLVVLSGCETGVGQVESWEGVFGLRRAFVLAGAQTQVMSLWRVSDDSTRELMVAYYHALLAGKGRAEALRDAQLDLMSRRASAHPYHWAGFIVSGNPRPLVAAPEVPATPRPPGCSCQQPAGWPSAVGWPGALLAMWLLRRLTKRRQGAPRRSSRL